MGKDEEHIRQVQKSREDRRNIYSKEQLLEQIAQRIDVGSRLLRAWDLTGGVSAKVTGLEMQRTDGQIIKVIVRQHGNSEMKDNSRIETEFKLMKILKSEGQLVPMPYYFDQSFEILSTPYLTMEFIDGESEFRSSNINAYIFQLAANLAKLHHIDCSKLNLVFLPRQVERVAKMLNHGFVNIDKELNEDVIRNKLKIILPFLSRNKEVILHGDFWPGNVLWKDGHLVSIIDWEDAAIGDPLADLANARLEIFFRFGLEAMNNLTIQYKVLMTTIDFRNLAYWDLFAALRLSKFPEWGLDKNTEQTMKERHRLFIIQALKTIDTI